MSSPRPRTARTAVSQHARDKRILDKLAMNASAIPEVRMIEAQSDEAKSVLQMKLSRNRLLALGLNEKEFDDIPRRAWQPRGVKWSSMPQLME